MTKTYEEQVWRYIVIELEGQIVFQNDWDYNAVNFCINHPKPAKVKKVLTDEIIYQNF